MDTEKFTPMNADRTKRLEFDNADVEEISGDIHERVLGYRGLVRIKGTTYQVLGISCGLANCNCDAMITPADNGAGNLPRIRKAPYPSWFRADNSI